MLFRLSFALAMLILSLNVSVVFNIEKANPVEKAFIFGASLILLMRSKVDRSLLLPVAIILLATVIGAFFTSYPNFEWNFYFRQMVNFTSLLIFLIVIPREKDRIELLRIVSFVPLLQASIGVVYAILGWQTLFYVDATIAVPRFNGSTGPAFLGGACVCGALAAMFCADQKSKNYIWLVGINFLICLLTAGRMATFVLMLCCSGVFFFGFKRFRHIKAPLLLLGGALGTGLLAVAGQALLTRAVSGDEKSRDVIRDFLWQFYQSYPDFGIGFGHLYTIFTHEIIVRTGVVAAHNEYLTFLVELGGIGGAIFAFGWLFLFFKTWSSPLNKNRTVYAVAILGFLIYSLTDNTFVRTEISLLMAVAAYGTRYRVVGRSERVPIESSEAKSRVRRRRITVRGPNPTGGIDF